MTLPKLRGTSICQKCVECDKLKVHAQIDIRVSSGSEESSQLRVICGTNCKFLGRTFCILIPSSCSCIQTNVRKVCTYAITKKYIPELILALKYSLAHACWRRLRPNAWVDMHMSCTARGRDNILTSASRPVHVPEDDIIIRGFGGSILKLKACFN